MGRPHNSKDKNRKFLLNRLQDMYGKDFDPIMRAAEMAVLLQAEAMSTEENRSKTLKDSIDAWLKVGEFIMPKLKAVELSQDPENPLFEMSEDDRLKEITKLISEGAGEALGITEGSGTTH